MRRDAWTLPAPTLGGEGTVLAYGHWGVPVLFFPAEGGSAWDVENHGIIHALTEPIEAGRIKVYCVPSYDQASWSNRDAPLAERARNHGVVPRSSRCGTEHDRYGGSNDCVRSRRPVLVACALPPPKAGKTATPAPSTIRPCAS